MHPNAARMAGNIGAQKAHDKLTVGMHHIKMHIQSLSDGPHAGERHISVPQKDKLCRFQVMQGVALEFLPPLALGCIDMDRMSHFLQLLI